MQLRWMPPVRFVAGSTGIYPAQHSHLSELLSNGAVQEISVLSGQPVAVTANTQGEIAVAGIIGRFVQCRLAGGSAFPFDGLPAGDIYVARFQAPDLALQATTTIPADCQSRPTGVAYTSNNVLVLSATTIAPPAPITYTPYLCALVLANRHRGPLAPSVPFQASSPR